MIFLEYVGSRASLSAKVSVTSCKTTSYADFSFKGAPNLHQNFSGNRTNGLVNNWERIKQPYQNGVLILVS